MFQSLVSTSVLSLLCFLFTLHFCPTLFFVESGYQCVSFQLSHRPNHFLKTWFLWEVLSRDGCHPCDEFCRAQRWGGVLLVSQTTVHFFFVKWNQADDPPASLKHTEIITNGPHYSENPPPLFWAVQSLHPHDSISPHQCTDHCPQGLAHPGKGSSNTCPAAPAAAKLLQSCPTLCDPIDRQPNRLHRPWDSPGKNTGVGCHFLLQCMKVKVKSLSHVRLLATLWTAAYQAPPSMRFSRQEYWSGVPLPSL